MTSFFSFSLMATGNFLQESTFLCG